MSADALGDVVLLPCVGAGHLGQLCVDLLVEAGVCRRDPAAGGLEEEALRYLLPVAGYVDEPCTQLIRPLEVYTVCNGGEKISVVHQRSPPATHEKAAYLDWWLGRLASRRLVVAVTGAAAGSLPPLAQTQTTDSDDGAEPVRRPPLAYAAVDAAPSQANSGLAQALGRLEAAGAVNVEPLQRATLATRLGDFELVPPRVRIVGGGMADGLLHKCAQTSVSCVVLAQYCDEGDGGAQWQAQRLAAAACAAVGVDAPNQWPVPFAWHRTVLHA